MLWSFYLLIVVIIIQICFKFKLDGKRLVPTKSVKYLGVLLDEHLHWNEQVSQVKVKLNRAIGILSKLRYNANLSVLKIIYHSLFGSHLLYSSQIWGVKDSEGTDYFQTLQNRALKKIIIKKRRDSATCIYKDNKIQRPYHTTKSFFCVCTRCSTIFFF